MANHSEVICSDEGDSGEPEMETSSRGGKRAQGSILNSTLVSDDGDSGEIDMGSFIRIRSEGDGIFEDEDDDEFEEDYISPEVDLGSPPSRKRKQDINFREHDIIEISDEPEYHEGNVSMDQDIFQMRRRDRTPLYLLNPNDYAHDHKKQIQIRRAIITYRHHQEKKAQIILLTEESGKLREHVEALKSKVLELASCGCPKNKRANLDVLNVEIPIVPPRMYIRGNRPVMAMPYNKGPISAEMIVNSTEIRQGNSSLKQQSVRSNSDSQSQLPQVKDEGLPRPFVNIASTRLQQITSSTLGSVNIAGNVPRSFTTVTINGTRTLTSQAGSRPPNLMQRPSGANPNLQIKVEPGSNSDQSNTATSASRIVFAKQPGGQQTASQLLFASKSNPTPIQINANGLPVSQHLNLNPKPNTPVTSTSKPVPQLLAASSMGTLLRTASGQVLRVVQSPNPQSNVVPGPSKVQPQKYTPILPKPESPKQVYNSQVTKEALKHMWSRFDDEDEDELAIIAAISGRSPSQILADSKTNSRKQVIGRRESFPDEASSISNNILRTSGADIELNKYADIVFEEAD